MPYALLLLQQRAGADCAGGIQGRLAGVDVTKDALFVDDESEATCESGVLVENAECLGVVLARIAQQREIELHLLAEGQVGPGRIHAHAEDRGVVGVELRVVVPVPGHLSRSTRRERGREESEHDHLLALEVGELCRLRLRASAIRCGLEIWEREIGHRLADLHRRWRWRWRGLRRGRCPGLPTGGDWN